MSWDSIIGQQRVKEILRTAVQAYRIPHAYLFYGPEGVGKDAAAIELAKVVNCDSGGEAACDRCESCLRFDSLQHPNLTLVFALPVGKGEKAGDPPLAKLSMEEVENIREQIRLKASNRYHAIAVPRATAIKVNSIRDIKRQASLTPYRRGKKVILIIDAESMNDEASNALLKTLEEPLEDTMLILTTSHRERIVSTIASRCQNVRFDFLTEHEIATYLMRGRGIDHPRAMLIGRLAHGSITRAFELLDVDLQGEREKALSFLRTLHRGSVLEVSKFIEELGREYDRIRMERFLRVLQFWIRDALCLREGYATIINLDQQESIQGFVRMFARLNYARLLERIDDAISLIHKNVYIPLILTVLALDVKEFIAES